MELGKWGREPVQDQRTIWSGRLEPVGRLGEELRIVAEQRVETRRLVERRVETQRLVGQLVAVQPVRIGIMRLNSRGETVLNPTRSPGEYLHSRVERVAARQFVQQPFAGQLEPIDGKLA